MTCRPVSDRELIEHLWKDWGIAASRIIHLHLGRARGTQTFQATTANECFFLKLKSDFTETGIQISRCLAENDVSVATPILSLDGNAWGKVNSCTLLVFKFLNGAPIKTSELNENEWSSLGSALRSVHETSLPESLRNGLRYQEFIPSGGKLLSRIETELSISDTDADEVRGALVALWSRYGSLPRNFLNDVRQKGEKASLSRPTFCLCHGDFQSGNILRAPTGEITLIDWDNPIWAPPETDLMFIEPRHYKVFASGYGTLNVNQTVLAFENANWILQECLDCADRILFTAGVDEEEKQWALGLSEIMLERMRNL